ncbi:MAG: hypothetical protein MUC96_02245 [Myxococcaceae bacterium]|jgi:hypothetical protein|nr:hypothetical protein [Myxococcaceae bacterium]
MNRSFVVCGVVFALVGCRHVPTRSDVVTNDVTAASDVVAGAFLDELKTHPELPPAFTSAEARDAYRRGLENDFARASGVDPASIGPGLAQTVQALEPTEDQKKIIFLSAERAAAISMGVLEFGVAIAPFVFQVAKILIQLPLAIFHVK